MKSGTRVIRRLAVPFLCGASLLQVGPCTRDNVQQEFRDGFVSAVTGLLQIGVQAFADELFAVEN